MGGRTTSSTKLSSYINKYLNLIPFQTRDFFTKLADSIELDYPNRVIKIGQITVGLPDPTDDVALYNTMLLLIYSSGNARQLDDHSRSLLALALKSAVIEAIQGQKQQVQTLQLQVEIKHVTEREQLAQELANYILNNYTIKTFYSSVENGGQSILGIYCFDGVIYKECEVEIIKKMEEYVKQYPEINAKMTKWVENEAINKIRLMTLTELRYEPLTLAFNNVLFDWQKFLNTGSIREAAIPPNPDIIVFHHIPHRLRIDLFDNMPGLLKFDDRLLTNLEELAQKLCPNALNAFKAWVDEKWPLLFEIIGYTLYPRYDMHKAVMLVGEGRNGKSTYLRLVKEILGPWNISSESLQDLVDENKRFTVSELYHKLANIHADLPNKALTTTGRFKILTGEDSITADRKYREPITFVNYAKLLFSANELPPVHDMTLAFWRRWLVIQFPHQFPPDQYFYEKTFTEQEIEGVILVSLYAFRNAWLRRKFSFEDSEADYKELWLRETNSVYAFIQDLLSGKVEGYRTEKCEDCKVETTKLYELYVKWCDSEDRTPLAKRLFTIEMERLGYKRVKVHGHPYYKGIDLETTDEQTGLDLFK